MFGKAFDGWNWSGLEKWESPQRLSDGPDLVIMSDLIEKNTANPRMSFAPHGSTGFIEGEYGVSPATFGSQGGVVTSLDGSTQWRDQNDMEERKVNEPNGGQRGYW